MNMRRRLLISAFMLLCLSAAACGGDDSKTTATDTDSDSGDSSEVAEPGWTVLIDGAEGLENFSVVGSEADWSAVDGAIQATTGGDTPSFLVSRQSFDNFALHVEFWASDDANSGVFLRCQDPTSITENNCYEANIFDQRPDPTYGTGGIVNMAPAPDPMPKAGGKWNTYEITARDDRIVLILNGETTVDFEDSRFESGPIALQWGRGTMRFRKVEIREL